MTLFRRIFAAICISLVAIVSLVFSAITVKQISDMEKYVVERYTISGNFMSKEIEHDYLEQRWPLERLKKLSERPGFLFWWIVRDDGLIYLADQAALMGTAAYDYFPQMRGKVGKEQVFLHRRGNYGIFGSPLRIGKQQWSFWLGFSLSEVKEAKRRIILLAALLTAATLLFLGTVLYVIVRHYTSPIIDLTLGAATISRGDLTHRVEVKSDDEVGQLAQAFNKMVDDLQAGERFLASIFNSIQDGISILDRDYNIVRVNPAMERWYAKAMPLVGKKCYEAYHWRNEPCEVCPTRGTMETGVAAREVVEQRTPGGELIRYVDVFTFPLVDLSSGVTTGVVEYVRDATHQRQAEEALMQSEEKLRQAVKMEAVGRLAGGVAHDFNNIMTAIIGYSELILMELREGNPLAQDVKDILQAAHRAASLTRQLLAFSRKQVLQPQDFNLNNVVGNMDKMLRRIIGEDIDLVTVLEPVLGIVRADPGQIEQVIVNLAVNARDAMPQGGKLTLETANVYLDELYVRRHAEVQPGPYVLLAMSDTGVGMDTEAQTRIFEPFFTTKEQGKGTGLGLSTVYGIVRQSGGFIWVYSEVGAGSTFKIYLPRIVASKEKAGIIPLIPVSQRGSETILLLEDEDLVRQVTRRILAQHGYRVLEAADGPEALEVSRKHPEPIKLMVTDVILPSLSGREVAARLQGERPEMQVLYMSGHTENAIVHHGVLDPGTFFIQKPFRQEALLQKVREVLDCLHPQTY